jgi:C1A family cysteine protease
MSLQQHEKEVNLPSSFALIDLDELQVYDQGSIGSCTANAIAQQIQIKTKNKLSISRLYQYFNSRLLERTVQEDSGANLLDCYKVLKTYNYVDESIYPYDITKFAQFPDYTIYNLAYNNKPIDKYEVVPQDLYHIQYTLAVYKQPIVIGAQIFSSFQNLDENFVCPTPDPDKDQLLGGHALLVAGYDNSDNTFLIVNSWSDKWGNKGTFKMKYDYLLNKNLVSDLWSLSLGF